jgi:hypothetical protein
MSFATGIILIPYACISTLFIYMHGYIHHIHTMHAWVAGTRKEKKKNINKTRLASPMPLLPSVTNTFKTMAWIARMHRIYICATGLYFEEHFFVLSSNLLGLSEELFSQSSPLRLGCVLLKQARDVTERIGRCVSLQFMAMSTLIVSCTSCGPWVRKKTDYPSTIYDLISGSCKHASHACIAFLTRTQSVQSWESYVGCRSGVRRLGTFPWKPFECHSKCKFRTSAAGGNLGS